MLQLKILRAATKTWRSQINKFKKINKNFAIPYLFIYFLIFWLHWVFVAVRGLSLVVETGGYSLLRCAAFSLRWLLFVVGHGL